MAGDKSLQINQYIYISGLNITLNMSISSDILHYISLYSLYFISLFLVKISSKWKITLPLFPVFFSGKCGPGDLCFTMLEQMENIDTKLGDYGDAQIL